MKRQKQNTQLQENGHQVVEKSAGKRKRIPEEQTNNISTDNTKEISDDSSDEEILVRTGDIPRKYYADYDHAGYNINSEKVTKPEKKDEVEKFMEKAKDKNWWRNIFDEMNNKKMFLSEKDLEIINRIRKGYFANKNVEDLDYFEKDVPKYIHPMNTHLRSKKKFGPSHYEMKKINRLVSLWKKGFIKFDDELPPPQEDIVYDIWTGETTHGGYHPGKGFQAPKRELPDTIESYNPTEEVKNSLQEEGKPVPVFGSLRKVTLYDKLIQENFDRCVELVTSARVIHQKTDITEEDILPKLPKPEELRPFPSRENYTFKGHEAAIKCLCIDTTGNYLISGDVGNNVYFWDITTTKIIKKIDLPDKILGINYNSTIKLVVVYCKESIYFMIAPFISRKAAHETRKILETSVLKNIREKNAEEEKNPVEGKQFVWKIPKDNSPKARNGILFYQKLKKDIGVFESLVWHVKGDYFATLVKGNLGQNKVTVHSLSKLTFSHPFSKVKGIINVISFHPNKPYFIVGTNSNIFIYNLQKQELVRKFVSNLNSITSLSVHKNGEHIIAGAKDGKVAWFQADLSDKPFKTLDYHGDKIRNIDFHPNYPLFASASRNGKIVIYHASVSDDLLQDPLIVPLKNLKTSSSNQIVNDIIFHCKYPWVFSCGDDKLIHLWT